MGLKHPDFDDEDVTVNNSLATNSNDQRKTDVNDKNVSSIVSSLVDSMPDVQPHAIALEHAEHEARATEWAELRDVDGNPFDPSVHKTDKHGNPTLTKLGTLIKKPGRKSGTKNSESRSFIGGIAQSEEATPEQSLKVQARASGVMAANLLITMGMVAGGDEWRPMKDQATGLDEKLMLEGAFADYFEATGKTDIPPGMALTVAIGGYALPRFTMPKTQSRMSKVKNAIKQWWINRKIAKHGFTAVPRTDAQKSQPDKMVA